MKNINYTHSSPITLESGYQLKGLTINYSTLGELNPQKDNVIWICHALTANSDVASWWPGLIGEGKIFDPAKHFIICANILGSCYGTSGPLALNPETGKPYYLNFPTVTIRDMVSAHEVLRKHLKIEEIHTCIGGSLGGQQAVEWGISNPGVIKNLVLLATNAYHGAWGIAFNEAQRMAIMADPTWKDECSTAGKEGLKAARAMALISYRNYDTYANSQSEEDVNKLDNYKAASYQKYQGEKLVKRFNCHSYWHLSKAMDSHHVGRGKENAKEALKQIKSNTLVIGIHSDILFPVCEQVFLSKNITGAIYQEIESVYGHDGFLIETEKIEVLIRDFYALNKVKTPSL